MIEPAHLVGAGGVVGAICRHLVGLAVVHDRLPLSTLLVNVAGSFVLGAVVAADPGSEVALLVGVGACGSFTTYSSFSFETVRLWETGDRLRATLYALGTLALCSLAAALAGGLVVLL